MSNWLADLGLTALDGTPLPAETLANKTLLIVNVASFCGFTPQYGGLVELHKELAGEYPFSVVGVPCNQFGAQEPGSAGEIAEFCESGFGVNFPLLTKQDVNGPDRSPLYAHLVGSEVGKDSDVRWNFEKFVVAADGRVTKRFGSRTEPNSTRVKEAIVDALGLD